MKKVTQHLSENLLVAISLSFIGGIIVSRENRYVFDTLEFFPIYILLLLALSGTLYFLKFHKPVLWLILLIAVSIGFQHNRLAMQPPAPNTHIYNRITQKTDIVLIATLQEMVTFNGLNSRALVQAKSIRFSSSNKLLPTSGKILLNLQGHWPKGHKAGDTLAIRCNVKRPNTYKTPGTFDYRRYLAAQNIWITGYIKSPILIHKISQQQGIGHKLRFFPERVREKIGDQLNDTLEGDSLSIYRAILLGDRGLITPNTLEAFKGSGTTHILAISGIHMTILGTLLYSLFYWILSRFECLLLRYNIRKGAACLCIPILTGYSLITGMNAPALRAVIMSCIVIIAIMTNRKKSPAPLVALAALILLFINPLQLYSVSFQLSFFAIISILFILPVLKTLVYAKTEPHTKISGLKKLLYWLLAGLLVSITATIGTAPLILSHFNRISTIGPISNLIIEPLLCLWSLPLGFISIPFSFFFPDISSFFLQIGSLGIELASGAATYFSSLHFSSLWLPTPPLWLIILFYVSFLLIGTIKGRKSVYSIPSLALLSISFVLMLGQDTIFSKRPESFQISYIDVGQGSASLLEDSAGHRVLIDGGGSSQSTHTVGERIIAPFLWHKGIRKIDAIIITHPDADHYNGLEYILRHFSPKLIWTRDTKGHDKNYENFIKLSKKYNVPVVIPKADQLLDFSTMQLNCVENLLNVFSPGLSGISASSKNRGLVIKTVDENISALFPGDIDKAAELHLVEGGYDLETDFLLSPHHGSKTSNSREFLAAVAPRHLIVSAAQYAQGRFPHSGLAKECALLGIDLLSTTMHGTITVKSGENGYKILKTNQFNNNIFSSFEPVLIGNDYRDGSEVALPSL